MKTVIINQARMGSTRLPGKIMKQVLGKPLLAYQVERLKRVKAAQGIVVATTEESPDDVIVELCDKLTISTFRGSEEDVLSRYYGAAQQENAEVVVRVTSDCPLIDPAVIDRVVDEYLNHSSECDYVANTIERTYPRGMDCEIFSFSALEQAHRGATRKADREHVTSFIYGRPGEFRVRGVTYSSDQSAHRWTVDTPEDFELVRRIIEALYPHKPQFTLEDCLDLLRQHPDWSELNRNVVQKT